ncbi:Protein of unknown function [Micrococcales bacterium KH10]|nr:Protein of unknown function [Micrococcales bacterium KH10]
MIQTSGTEHPRNDLTRLHESVLVPAGNTCVTPTPSSVYQRCKTKTVAHVRRATSSMRHYGDRGLATAEYAIATVAAAGFAGLLIVVLKSGAVRGLLEGIIKSALSM